jgi:hypothetical protein
MEKENTIDMRKTNLQKLKILVDELESLSDGDKGYTSVLSEIEKINLVKSDKKINHYEKICSTILSLIGKNKIN